MNFRKIRQGGDPTWRHMSTYTIDRAQSDMKPHSGVRAEIHVPHSLNSANNYGPLKRILGIFDHSPEERAAKIVMGSATISTGSPV